MKYRGVAEASDERRRSLVGTFLDALPVVRSREMASKKTRAPKVSKTAFILSQGDKPASEVVAAGKAENIEFSPAFVYAVRAKSKKSGAPKLGRALTIGKRAAAARAKFASKGLAAKAPSQSVLDEHDGDAGPLLPGGSLESQFAALAVELGISRAEAILRRVREVLEKLTF